MDDLDLVYVENNTTSSGASNSFSTAVSFSLAEIQKNNTLVYDSVKVYPTDLRNNLTEMEPVFISL